MKSIKERARESKIKSISCCSTLIDLTDNVLLKIFWATKYEVFTNRHMKWCGTVLK
jgi:hypothetical protein